MATADTSREGVLIERDDLAYLDSRALPWEPQPGLPGAHRKVLARDGAGEPRVFILRFAPRFAVAAGPRRHIHTTASELMLTLAGELPLWEYADADEQHGTLVRHRPGYALHRLPGSLHGFEPGVSSPVGWTSLVIRTGPGTVAGEPAFERESREIPYADGWQPLSAPRPPAAEPEPGTGVVIDRPGIRVLDSHAMEWTSRGIYGLAKVIAEDAEGRPLLTLQHVGPDFALPDHPERHSHAHDQYDFMLWGEFTMAEYERDSGRQDRILMRAGHFVHRRGGEIHGLVRGATSPTGCLTLQWYTDGDGNLVVGGGGTVDET